MQHARLQGGEINTEVSKLRLRESFGNEEPIFCLRCIMIADAIRGRV